MKKNLWIIAFGLVAFKCNSQSENKSDFTLKGTVSETADAEIILQRLAENQFKNSDTISVGEDKSFQFEGNTDEPGLYRLIFSETEKAHILIDKGDQITLTPDPEKEGEHIIKGSESTDIYREFGKISKPYEKEATELGQAYTSAVAQEDEEAIEELVKKFDQINDEINTKMKTFIKNIEKPFVAILLTDFLSADKDFLLMDSLADKFKEVDSKYMTAYRSRLEKIRKTTAGNQAPDFTQNNPEGTPVSLSDFKGKYLLVDFWASWCGPCRRENPDVVKMYNKFKDKDFEILGVSLDSDREKWISAIEKDELEWVHVSDLGGWKNTVAQLYEVKSIPATLLLDKTGKIIAKNLRGAELENKLEEILGE